MSCVPFCLPELPVDRAQYLWKSLGILEHQAFAAIIESYRQTRRCLFNRKSCRRSGKAAGSLSIYRIIKYFGKLLTMKNALHKLQGIDLFGGSEEDRTLDLGIANAALSQLSYRPMEVMMRFFNPVCKLFD